MDKQLVVFGLGDIGQLAHFYFTREGRYKVAGFTADAEYLNSDEFCGLPTVPFEELETRFPSSQFDLFVALSYSEVNQLRARKVAEAKEKGYELASYVSDQATVLSEEPIGENCFILEDNTIQPFAKIGNNVTLWSGNHIGHHSVIEDHVFISSHVVISGGVTIGARSFLGVNATFRDHIKIGKGNVIGAGALILGDTEDDQLHTAEAAKLARIPASRLRSI
ncbi:MAG: acetyltransferase [Verrucomicrobiota bacterium]